ncbi:MAG: hypothetical protein KGZ50_08670 [Peptococcaceae bacterium]|nr:hypothetical protein [Peptococcaceae bacterium]
MRLPNFFLLCTVRFPGRRLPLIIPLPIFLVDELLDSLGSFLWLVPLPRGLKQKGRVFLFSAATLPLALQTAQRAWHKIRMSGSYTLLEVRSQQGVHVLIKFI